MKYTQKFTSNRLVLIVIVALLVVSGGVLLISTHAATSVTSLEAETGTLSAGATKLSDATASGSQTVKFGIATTSSSGWPDATNTGVPGGTTLTKVPQQVTSGPGWSWNAQNETVEIRTAGTMFSGYDVDGNVDIDADNVTIKNTRVINDSYFAVEIRSVQNATITHSTIGGIASRYCENAIRPIYGTEGNLTVTYNNLGYCDSMVNNVWLGGLIADNYMHDFGQNDPNGGAHFNGIQLACGCGSGTPLLTIRHNAILNNQNQTDAIALGTDAGQEHNRLVDNNLLAGGSYCLYGGGDKPSTNIVITNNVFSSRFFPNCGSYGRVANYMSSSSGNVWSGNKDENGVIINP